MSIENDIVLCQTEDGCTFNNCYAFAVGNIVSTSVNRLRPGDLSNFPRYPYFQELPVTKTDGKIIALLRSAVKSDGLIPASKNAVNEIREGFHLVGMLYLTRYREAKASKRDFHHHKKNARRDFHFVRRNEQTKEWWHKKWGLPIANCDDSNKLMTGDLKDHRFESHDGRPYWFTGYYWCPTAGLKKLQS